MAEITKTENKSLSQKIGAFFTDWDSRTEWWINKRRQLGLPYEASLLKYQYRVITGQKLNLRHPKTYNDKLNWLKLYYRRHILTQMADKYTVRAIIKEKIGEEYLIPLLGAYDSFDDIDFDDLPDKFVLKCNHDSGSVIICDDKASFDKQAAREKLTKSLRQGYDALSTEWAYRDIPRKILAEQKIEATADKRVKDYKFFCFDGVVKMLYIADYYPEGGFGCDYYDTDFNHLSVCRPDHPNSPNRHEKPASFEEMKKIAAALSQGLPHVRVDLYDVQGKVYFGELTFYTSGGHVILEPDEWNYTLGDWIKLPPKTIEK